MTVAQDLVNRVKRIIQDGSFDDSDILGFLNGGVSLLSGGPELPKGGRLAPLPLLHSSGTVTAAIDATMATMPATYHRNLKLIVNATTGLRVKVWPSFAKYMNKYPAMDVTGSVTDVCLVGRSLYYQGQPSTAEILTAYFNRLPVDMSLTAGATQTEPDGIPSELRFDLLVNYACREIFSIIDGDGGEMGATIAKHDRLYQMALQNLARSIGDQDGEAFNIGDDGDSSGLNWFEQEVLER